MGIFPWFGKRSFSHGVHPVRNKARTSTAPIRRLPFPQRLIVQLDQLIGIPATPMVSKGQEVVRGEPITNVTDFFSVPLHAPATGVVRGIEMTPTVRGTKTPAIVIDVHQGDSQEVLYSTPHQLVLLSKDDLLHLIQRTGLVGLGGAAFPTHVKYTSPPDHEQEVDTLIVNGAECEPFLTADHRVMVEQPKDIVRGIRYAMRATLAEQAIIGIEADKFDAAEAIESCLKRDNDIRVKVLEPKYPQGAEKILIKSLLGRTVPEGELPRSIGVAVSNVGTMAQLGYLLPRGEGMIERVMTVSGPGVRQPGNYRIPIGAPLRFILQEVGYEGEGAEVILGGPMMGMAVSDLDTPVTKGVSGILVLNEQSIDSASDRNWPCIKCARCVKACPMHLNPSILGQLAAKRQYDVMMEIHNLANCFECGCCSYVCPSKISLVQYFRIAKAVHREMAA